MRNNKILLFIITINCPMVHGMENIPTTHENKTMIEWFHDENKIKPSSLGSTLPEDLKKNIARNVVNNDFQWWYLQYSVEEKNKPSISSLCTKYSAHACAGGDFVDVYDRKTGAFMREFYLGNRVASLAFSPSGKVLAIGVVESPVYFFDVISKNCIGELPCRQKKSTYALTYSLDGNNIAAGSLDNVSIYNSETRTLNNDISHAGCVDFLSYSPCGEYLYIGSSESASVFNVKTQQSILTIPHEGLLNIVSYSPTSQELKTVSYNKRSWFAVHNNYTCDQLLLKKIISLWLCVERPDKDIQSVEALLNNISEKFALSKHELQATWSSIPEVPQWAIWRTITYKIQKYGKNMFFTKNCLIM